MASFQYSGQQNTSKNNKNLQMTKGILEVCLQSIFFYLNEGGSVCSSPTNIGSTGESCICVGQNVSNNGVFENLWHLDILPTFCQH